MRRVYLVIAIILILAAAYGGYRYGRAQNKMTADLDEIIKVRDSLTVELVAANVRSKAKDLEASTNKKLLFKSDSTLAVQRKLRDQQADKHAVLIRSIAKLEGSGLDSFLVARYPRPTFNQSLRQVAIMEWRVSAIAQDLGRLDSITNLSYIQGKITNQLEHSLVISGNLINTLESNLAEKDDINRLLLNQQGTYLEESVVWKDEARKYKRQRNFVIIGGVLVSVGVVVIAVAATN